MEFDSYSQTYNTDLMKDGSLSGESTNYFARGRVQYIRDLLAAGGKRVDSIIEFGCGIGGNIEFLYQYFPES